MLNGWRNLKFVLRGIVTYRHCRVVFGLQSSPFLLGAVINHLLDNAPENLKITANKLKGSFYVDNCVTSVENEDELTRFIDGAKTLMMMGKFDLRGWVYSGMRGDENSPMTPLLGLMWDSQNDKLACNVKPLNIATKPVTKRVLLSTAQSVFDPIGFTSPVSLVPKLLLQETWKLKVGWDVPLPEGIAKPFNQWMTQIHLLNGCSIPRRLSSTSFDEGNCSLHIFSDASKIAYAACIFLRVEGKENTSVQLVCAKSRIAPCKEITIPRLELLAALIATRLYVQVKETLKITECKVYFWTDSSVVLTWINRKDDWSTFVANRCKEIRQNSDTKSWHHVPGHMNPADLPSRGCNIKVLCNSKWWEGPNWLYKEEAEWPNTCFDVSEAEVNREKKKTVVLVTNNSKSNLLSYFEKFSEYSKILRIFTWLLRFINKVKKVENECGELTGEEVREAENKLIGLIQKESFTKGKRKHLEKLQIYEDPQGILHVKSRLILGNDKEEFKCPKLLPSDHNLVHKLIKHYHVKNQHAGVQILLNILREQFWILGGRKTIKSVLSQCVHCKRHNAKSVTVPFAPLPKDRITDSNVFEVTGVDLAGPLFLKSGEKSWIVIFTCAVYRAVHFELVKSLSTDSFLQAFRRFIARRGRPSVIYSDNGTNFCGASNAFNSLNWDEICKETSVQKITWKFNPPTAAWWGGWWERLIKMLKDLLRRSLGRSSLFYEELYTVICDCECVLNSRPLTYVSSDNNDLIPLSPVMFLQSLGTNDVVDIDKIDQTSLAKRWRYVQRLREELRSRFRKEYLGMLVNYGGSKRNSVKVGDVVLVEVENLKRVYWPLAIVQEIYPGKDGLTRVVRVKTANGELSRPVQRLYPLEITSKSDMAKIHDKKSKTAKEKINQDTSQKDLYSRSGRKIKLPQRLDL